MQQQAIITDMAKDVPKQNFSIEKAKLHCQAQIMFIIKFINFPWSILYQPQK